MHFEHVLLHMAPATSRIARRCITGSIWWHFWHASVDCKWIVRRRQLLGIMSCTTSYWGNLILSDVDALYICADCQANGGRVILEFWCEGTILLSAPAPACEHRICFLEICYFLLWYSVANTSILENICVRYWMVLVIILIFGGMSKVTCCCQVLSHSGSWCL